MTETTPDAAARVTALEKELADLRSASDRRLVQAELKAEATRLGIVDLRCLELVDHSALKLNTDGTVPDAAAAIARFKRDSPWAFAQTSSSHAAPAPAAAAPEVKSAMQMTHDEWRAARAAILRKT